MVNEASEGQRQERTWWRLPAMLMCKPFENISKGTKDKPNHLKSMFVLSRVSLGIAAAEQLYQVARMMKRNRERVVLDPFSNIQMCKIKWLLSVNPRCKCLVVFFSLVFQSLFCFLSLLSPFPFPMFRNLHTGFSTVFSACRTTHTAHQTHTHTHTQTHTTTTNNTTPHTISHTTSQTQTQTPHHDDTTCTHTHNTQHQHNITETDTERQR